MLSWIREKFGTVVISSIIGLIAFVFVFFGVFNPKATRGLHEGAVAGKVNGDSITISEFNRELNRRIEYFKQMSGGKISEDQLKAFRIKEAVFQDLVRRKLMVQEAFKQGLAASDAEVMDAIREMGAFQKDGKFDVLTYKQVLQANHYTPGGFERLVREDMSSQRWDEYFRKRVHVSDEEAKDQFLTQNDKRAIKYVLLTPETGRKGIQVSSEDAKKYLTDPAKLNVAKAQFEAKKETQFKGKSFDDVKESIARDLLAGEKLDEVRKVNDKLADEVRGILTAKKESDSKVNSVLKPYGVEVKSSGLISQAAPFLPGVGEAKDLMRDAFAKGSPIDPAQGGAAKKYTFGPSVLVAVVTESQQPDLSKFDADKPAMVRQIAMKKQRELADAWLGDIVKKAKIDPNPSVIGSEE